MPQQPDWEEQLKYYREFLSLAKIQELGGAYFHLLSDATSYTTSIDIPMNGVIGSKPLSDMWINGSLILRVCYFTGDEQGFD